MTSGNETGNEKNTEEVGLQFRTQFGIGREIQKNKSHVKSGHRSDKTDIRL